jgi:hypothetical protein
MRKITNDSGEEIEVFEKADLDAKETELGAARKELQAKEEELKKLTDKDFNFRKLEEAKSKAEGSVEKLTKDFEDKLAATKKEVLEGVLKDHFNDVLSQLAGDDVELRKKIELQYGRLTDPAANKEEVAKKLRDAYTLASKPVEDPGALNTSVISSGGVGRLNIKTDKKFSAEEKALGQKLAAAGGIKLEDKDFEK